MIRYHSSDGKSTNALIELQLSEFRRVIAVRKAEPVWDYSALYRNANARWRVLALVLSAGLVIVVSLRWPDIHETKINVTMLQAASFGSWQSTALVPVPQRTLLWGVRGVDISSK